MCYNATTVGANKKIYILFSFYGVNHSVPFLQNPPKYDCWLWFPQGMGNFWHDISSVRSKLSTWKKVECIAKACSKTYPRSKKTSEDQAPSWWGGVWQQSLANCISGSWTATNRGQRSSYRETLGIKHIMDWTALDIGCSRYECLSTLTVWKPYKRCVLCFHSKTVFWRMVTL